MREKFCHSCPVAHSLCWLIAQVSLGLFLGRGGTPIPFRVPITLAVGEPIKVDRNPDATKQDIEVLHSRVLAATKELYYTHREAYGVERELEIAE